MRRSSGVAQPHLGAKRGLRAVLRNLFAWLLVFIVVFFSFK